MQKPLVLSAAIGLTLGGLVGGAAASDEPDALADGAPATV